jgi:hypothetical protein
VEKENGGRQEVGRGEERRMGAVVVDHAASRAENSAASGEWRWRDRKVAGGTLARCSTPPRCGHGGAGAIAQSLWRMPR